MVWHNTICSFIHLWWTFGLFPVWDDDSMNIFLYSYLFLLGKTSKNGIAGSFGRHVFEHDQFNKTSLWVSECLCCIYLAYQIKVHTDHTGTNDTHTQPWGSYIRRQLHSSSPNMWRGLPEGNISQDDLQFCKIFSAQTPDTLEITHKRTI